MTRPYEQSDLKRTLDLVTRSGKPARILAVLDNKTPARLVTVCDGRMESHYIDGRYELIHESPLDLFVEEL